MRRKGINLRFNAKSFIYINWTFTQANHIEVGRTETVAYTVAMVSVTLYFTDVDEKAL